MKALIFQKPEPTLDLTLTLVIWQDFISRKTGIVGCQNKPPQFFTFSCNCLFIRHDLSFHRIICLNFLSFLRSSLFTVQTVRLRFYQEFFELISLVFRKPCICSPLRIFIASIFHLFQFIKRSLRSLQVFFDILVISLFFPFFHLFRLDQYPLLIYSTIRRFNFVIWISGISTCFQFDIRIQEVFCFSDRCRHPCDP